MLAWAHYAPALNDSFRKTYRRLLRWNDELPFVKFALAEDERIMLTAEVPDAALDRDAVGRTLARLVAVCDLLHEESKAFLGDWGKPTPSDTTALLARYAAEVAELEAPEVAEPKTPAAAELEAPAEPVT
jgi:Putative bacterial sensory transduction regulator